MRNKRFRLQSGVLIGGLLILSVALLTAPASAAPRALPPRPTMEPMAMSVPQPVRGGYIQLQVSPGSTSWWAVVQWQDAHGGWHDVEGWRGTLAADGYQVWWVAEADWGKGPFRWRVYETARNRVAGTSASFYLPRYNREWVKVKATLMP